MSEAEDKFFTVVRQALVDASAIGDPDQLDDYTDAVVGSLKLDDWLIVDNRVRQVVDYAYEDAYGLADEYAVWVPGED